MGKSYTPKYRVEYRDNASRTTSFMFWDTKRDGKPSDKNLEKWRKSYNKSFDLNGTNYHVSKGLGFIVHISRAWIVEQATGEYVAETNAPMFEVV